MNLSFFTTLHSRYSSLSFAFPSLSPNTKPSSRKPPPRWIRMDLSSPPAHQKEKIIVIMGATGCGKTRLSIDLASRFQSEIINSDKMQVYKGLDITTNKITLHDRHGIPHHLLGDCDPENGEFFPSDFRFQAGLSISDIVSRQKLPLLVGGSNSFIHALLVDHFNPEFNFFQESSINGHDDKPVSDVSTRLRYRCCFIWVDVSLPLLCDYLCKRVDEMLESGMFEELSGYCASVNPANQPGLRKAIGVPEFDRYFEKYPPGYQGEWDEVRRGAYEEAVRMIKDNTCQLAERQIGKIMKLKNAGWDLQRVDATEAFRELLMRTEVRTSDDDDDNVNNNNNNNNNNIIIKKKKKRKKKKKWMEIWERDVLKPSMKIVNHFLDE